MQQNSFRSTSTQHSVLGEAMRLWLMKAGALELDGAGGARPPRLVASLHLLHARLAMSFAKVYGVRTRLFTCRRNGSPAWDGARPRSPLARIFRILARRWLPLNAGVRGQALEER